MTLSAEQDPTTALKVSRQRVAFDRFDSKMTACLPMHASGSLTCRYGRTSFSPAGWLQTTACTRRAPMRISAASDIQPGARIRVSQPVTVFHSPKHKPSLSLEGLEGTVTAVVKEHKGKELSANLPIRVQFALPAADGGKETKLIAHLVRPPPPPPPPPARAPSLDPPSLLPPPAMQSQIYMPFSPAM